MKFYNLGNNSSLVDNLEKFRTSKSMIENIKSIDEQNKDIKLDYFLKNNKEVLNFIEKSFQVTKDNIENIKPMDIGMTNSSFTFKINGDKFICRLAGEGTDELVSRKGEYYTYKAIKDLEISDRIINFDKNSGMKISQYFPHIRSLDFNSDKDIKHAIDLIKKLHQAKLKVKHNFDIIGKIKDYIALCGPGLYQSSLYQTTKDKMKFLLELVKKFEYEPILIHADTSKNNFLINQEGKIILIDWEYAGMADPILELALFFIYGDFEEDKINKYFTYYLGRKPLEEELIKVYTYMSLGGFLWAIWTEYKMEFGLDYYNYRLRMYNHANSHYNNLKRLVKFKK